MNETNTPPTTAPEPWRRRRFCGRFSAMGARIFASPTWWQSVPRKSILNAPGNKFQPKSLGDNFKKGPLSAARIVQKFFDRRGRGFARLSTGTIIHTNENRPA